MMQAGTIAWRGAPGTAPGGDALLPASLARFNLLPSTTLHAQRIPDHDSQGHWRRLLQRADAAVIHRHWSRAILAALGIDARIVLATDHPLMPLAVLPADQVTALAARLGLQLCGTPLRGLIRRDDLQAVFSSASYTDVQAARAAPRTLDYPPAADWNGARIAQDHLALGCAALLHACAPLDDALGARLALKLPPTDVMAGPIDASRLPGPAELADASLGLLHA